MSDPGSIQFVDISEDILLIRGVAKTSLRQLGVQLRNINLFEDVVDGIETLTVRFDPIRQERESLFQTIRNQLSQSDSEEELERETIELSVVFGGDEGPDFDQVCSDLNLDADTLIDQICAFDLYVDMLGFTPGFAYIRGLPDGFEVPRLNTPKARLPAGSLGIAAGMIGTYALDGPGGWPIIGRLTTRLFDPAAKRPFLLEPGARIKIRKAAR